MAKNFVQKGEALHIIAAGTEKSGDLVVVNDVVGVAITDGEADELLALHVEGVWNVPVPASVATINQGASVYFNTTSKEITLTASGNKFIGYAWEAGKANGVVPIKLMF